MPYSFRFSSNAPYRYAPGSLFLGVDPGEPRFEVGIQTDRHAITVAGSRSGKGAALMIPNLKLWPHNALVIDPKGEAAEATAEIREKMGQAIHVLDPFKVANVPDRFRAKLNPLTSIQPDALDAREQIGVIADGLVLRSDAKAAYWDNGGMSLIAGIIAFIIDQAPPEHRNLLELRSALILPRDALDDMAGAMQLNQAFGGLAASAGSKLLATGTERGHFMSVAEAATDWLSSPAMVDLLSDTTFSLSDLKTEPCTVYLVLPPDLLGEHARFLRLFVRMAIKAMAKGGTKGGRRCLFMLDEFYSLGRIDEIAKAAGMMPGYGVTLWPFLQDLGQLVELYGREGSNTFFGNSDAHIFFGNTDGPSLDYVSERIGRIGPSEMPAPPSQWVRIAGKPNPLLDMIEANEMRTYQHETAGLGGFRLPPDQVRERVMKGHGDAVARSMIVFAKGSDVLNVRLWPYFWETPLQKQARLQQEKEWARQKKSYDKFRRKQERQQPRNSDEKRSEPSNRASRIMPKVAALLLSVLLIYLVWHAYNLAPPTPMP